MNKSNQESLDSPFVRQPIKLLQSKTKTIKQKLSGGVSIESPTYFHLRYIDILDQKSRTQELFKGYKRQETSDYKLVIHPELIPQEKKYFNYEDFRSNGGKKVFDYSTFKPSTLIDLLADKRPEFKQSSNFYKNYQEKLKNDGFGLSRGIFTIESNQRSKFGMTTSSRFFNSERSHKGSFDGANSAKSRFFKQIITEQAKNSLPVQFRSSKKGMSRFLSNKQYTTKSIQNRRVF